MFKLSIEFATLATLSAFVQKMGGEVIGGTISHDQNITSDSVPAETPADKPASKPRTRSARATTTTAPQAPATDLAPNLGNAPQGGQPFPAAPTSFAPGNAPSAPAQPVHQPAQSAPVSAPVNTPVAPAQVDPARQQWNVACGELIGALEKTGLDQAQCDGIIQGCFAKAGAAPQKISGLSDAQIQPFYYALNEAVNGVIAGMNQAQGLNQKY